MKLIQSLAYKGASYVAKNLGENHEKRSIYYYSLQVIIGEFIKLLMVLIVSFILGFFKPVAICVTTFIFMRTAAGGYHMNTHGKCVIASFLMFVVSGAILQYTHSYWPFMLVIAFIAVSGLISLLVIIKRAPADTPNKPITKPGQIKRLKNKSIIYLCLTIVVSVILAVYGLKIYALAVISGLLLEIFTVTALGYRIFDMLSGKNKLTL